MDKIELSTSALADALQITPEQVAELVKTGDEFVENYESIITEKFNERVKTTREAGIEKEKKARENLINKAVKEKAQSIESEYKKIFGLNGEFEGETLTAKMQELYNAAKSDIDEEKIKTTDVYQQAMIAAEAKAKETLAGEVDEWRTKYQSLQTETQRAQLNNALHRQGMAVWAAKEGDIMDMSEEVKKNLMQTYLSKLEAHPWKQLDGNLVLVDKDGELLEDDLGNRISASETIERAFLGLIPLKQQGGRSSTGDSTDFGEVKFSFGSTKDEFGKNYSTKFAEVNNMPRNTQIEREARKEAFVKLEQIREQAKKKNLI